MTDLPRFDPHDLAEATPERLLELLIEHADQVTRPLFDACLDRGAAMVDTLAAFYDLWDDPDPKMGAGKWWTLLHGIYLLGAMEGEAAGRLLLRALRQAERSDDLDLQDWLAGDWPQFFANKPATVIELARELAEEQKVDWYMRYQAAEVVVDAGLRQGAEALETALDWAAGQAADPIQHPEHRYLLGLLLLHFPSDRHRPLLERLVEEQLNGRHPVVTFGPEQVEQAYARGRDDPDWQRRGPYLAFYDDEEIANRQRRWQEEAEREIQRAMRSLQAKEDPAPAIIPVPAPYHREAPKPGRNDPCPCGSGKKYKKCCLAVEQARDEVLRSLG